MKERLIGLYNERKTAHRYRIKAYGFAPADPDLEVILAYAETFNYCCPFCGIPFDSLSDSDLNLCHIHRHTLAGNSPYAILFSCEKCNRIINKFHADYYFSKTGQDSTVFWQKVFTVRKKIESKRNAELAELASSPMLVDLALVRLLERFKDAR